MFTEMTMRSEIKRSGPLPDYDRHTRLLVVEGAVLDLA
jgi:hypothetical protein